MVVSHYFDSKIAQNKSKDNHDKAHDPAAEVANAPGYDNQKADNKRGQTQEKISIASIILRTHMCIMRAANKINNNVFYLV